MKMTMRNALGFLTTSALVFGFSTGAHAAAISFSDPGATATSVSGMTTVDFNDGTHGAYTGASGDYGFVSGSEEGYYAEPQDIDSPFLAVPRDHFTGSVQFDLGSSANYFGLYWGSIDDYNSISFYEDGSLVGSFSGDDVAGQANGHQSSYETNRYVNFDFGSLSFDQVELHSDGWAFESDNHAFGVTSVPEPGAVLLLGVGLAGLRLARRRERNVG